jgi:hypothetical protein
VAEADTLPLKENVLFETRQMHVVKQGLVCYNGFQKRGSKEAWSGSPVKRPN